MMLLDDAHDLDCLLPPPDLGSGEPTIAGAGAAIDGALGWRVRQASVLCTL